MENVSGLNRILQFRLELCRIFSCPKFRWKIRRNFVENSKTPSESNIISVGKRVHNFAKNLDLLLSVLAMKPIQLNAVKRAKKRYEERESNEERESGSSIVSGGRSPVKEIAVAHNSLVSCLVLVNLFLKFEIFELIGIFGGG